MPVGDIARQQPLQVADDFAGAARATGVSLEGDHGRQPAVDGRAELGKSLQNLGEQVRAALGEGVGKEHRRAVQRIAAGSAADCLSRLSQRRASFALKRRCVVTGWQARPAYQALSCS